MRVLIGISGSHGDLHPFLALGRELKRRGHDVRVFVSAYFEEDVRRAGLEPVPIGPYELYDEIVHHPDAFHPTKGFKVIAKATLDYVPELYRRLEAALVPGDTLAIGSTLAFAVRLLQEKRGVPAVTVHLSPSVFRSAIDPPLVGEAPLPRWFRPFLTRLTFRVIDALFVDPVFAPELNRFRSELGLPPVKRVFHDWIHDADVVVGLFPEWFAEPRPDWPKNLRVTGFPFYDGPAAEGLAPDVEAFLAGGAPPVVFTSGTAMASAHAFFEASVEACRRSGRRGMLLTRYPEQVRRDLPGGVRHFEYVPFSKLFPRVAAVVHHGGIGTLSQALAAGTPQLVRPLAFDQHDNARHLGRLGVSRTIAPKSYRPETVAAALDELAESREVRAACRAATDRLEGRDAAGETADVILEALR